MATSGLAKRCRDIYKTQAAFAKKTSSSKTPVLFKLQGIVSR